jgi:preprotein translocase subunit SecY
MLLVVRVGSFISVPGINVTALHNAGAVGNNTLFGMFDMFVGGAYSNAAIFSLGIMPYISTSIIIQLLGAVVPYFQKLQQEGEEGRKQINNLTRYGTVLLSFAQGVAIAISLQARDLGNGTSAVAPGAHGLPFVLSAALIFTAGTVFLMWVGEQITEKGIGNGMSLIIFFSIIEAFPQAAAQVWTLWRTDVIGIFTILAFLAIMIAIVAGTVVMTMAIRKIPIQIPRKVVGRNRIRQGQKTHLPLRVNSAGVMPIIFAQSIMFVPPTIATFLPNVPFMQTFATAFSFGSVWYIIVFTALIVFFTYFYTAIIFNPIDLAENMKKQGGFIPGTRPGARTAEYIDHVLTRVTLPGSFFLAAIAIVPLMIFSWGPFQSIPQFIGGTGLLIVVGVALDTIQQMQSHLLMRHYEGFMTKGKKIRGRR